MAAQCRRPVFRGFRRAVALAMCVGMALACAGAPSHAADLSSKYTWKPMLIGAGGFVVGMWAHPTAPGLFYCRVDVAGGYRWDGASKSWKNVLTTASMTESVFAKDYKGVDSLVGAKSDPNVAYMAYDNKIYKSANRGDKWEEASGSFNVAMNANGHGSQCGERLGVDPANKDVVYYGSMRDGLWYTLDGGAQWKQVDVSVIPFGTVKELGVTTVRFDEKSGVDAKGRTKGIYATVAAGGVFQSMDAGATWKKISGGAGTPADEGVAVDACLDKNGNYYIADPRSGMLWRYSPQGQWETVLKGKTSAIAVDPFDPNRLMVMIQGGMIQRSTDFGRTWTALSPIISESGDTPWLVTYHRPKTTWLSTGQLVFDPTTKDKLWCAEGFGVMTATNLAAEKTIDWSFINKGIECLCSNQIVHTQGGVAIGTGWDLGAFRFTNPDKPADAQLLTNKFYAAWGIDWMGSNPKNLVANVTTEYNWSMRAMHGLMKSSDGGVTWTLLSDNLPKDMKYGTVAVSAGNADHIVWLPSNKSGVYYTKDGGVTWQTSAQNVTTGWVSHALPRKSLASDKVLSDVFYITAHDDRKVYKSTDGGATWESVSDLPGGRWSFRHCSELKTVHGKAGHLWYAEGKEQSKVGALWRSIDGGATWESCSNGGLTEAYAFGFGKEIASGKYPTIFLNGVVNGVQGIYRSTDEGQTWDKIGQHPFGIWSVLKCIDGDKDVFGKVYFGFRAGIGFGYGTTAESPGKP